MMIQDIPAPIEKKILLFHFFQLHLQKRIKANRYMRNSVLLKVNEKPSDAKIFFSPETADELKEHIADIEHKISNSTKLVDNEDVINRSKKILNRYENQMV